MAELIGKIPQYQKVYEILKGQIIKGIYQDGDLIPSENELCSIHEITRPTVRQALNELVVDGYIKKQRGKGSVVCKPSKSIGILSIQGTSDGLKGHNLETHIIDKAKATPWPDDLGFELSKVEEESGCIQLSRLRLVDGSPVLFEKTYIANLNLPRFTLRKLENTSLFAMLQEHYQVEIKGGKQKIWAEMPKGDIQELLQVSDSEPLVCLARKITTNREHLCIYSKLYYQTKDFVLEGAF